MNILLLYFSGATLISILMYFLKNKIWDYLLFVIFIGLQIFLNIHEYFFLGKLEGEYFKTDGVGLIFLTVLTILTIPTIIHSAINAHKNGENEEKRSVYDSALVMFVAVMSGALISNNVGLTWAFLEATTLCASVLIYHDRDAAALEAAWKYVFISSIGIAFAFIGILFLGIASQEASNLDLSTDSLMQSVRAMNPIWLKISFLFIITGYSVKLGVAPLFTVDIDAKDAAPAPIAGMFSGALLNVGFVAIFRFFEIFSLHPQVYEWMNQVLIIVGVSSIFFAAVYIMRVKNYKRLFAYSSVEHGGIVLLGLAAGGIGYIAVILHLIFHSFIKASLFFQIAQVSRAFSGSTHFDGVGKYFKYNPVGGLVFLIGFFSLAGLPPSGMFLSKFLTMTALFESGHWIIVVFVFILLAFIFYGLGKNFFQLLFGPHPELTTIVKINPLESLSQIILLFTVIYLGVNPPEGLITFIKNAVQHLPNYSYGIF